MRLFSFFHPLLLLFILMTPGPVNSSHSHVTAVMKLGIETDKKTVDFLVKATDIRLAGIKMGETAIEKGTVADIKAYGELMIRDHTATLERIKAFALERNIELPTQLSKSSEKKWNKLKELSGQNFNKYYVKLMISAHKDEKSDFETAAKGADKEVAEFASRQIHTINLQLQRVYKIQDRL